MIRHPNKHTDAKGYRISDEKNFMYEEGEASKQPDNTHSPTAQTRTIIYVTSAIPFEVDDRLMLPNKSNTPFVIVSIPRSVPKYNKRRGKRGRQGGQIKEWTLELGGR